MAFVALTVTFSTTDEAKIVLMRFAAEPLFLLETRPCRPVKFASFLRTGRREGRVMFAVALARRPRRFVRRLVALDGAVALAAAGGWVALVAATTGAAVAAASPLAGFEAAAAGLGGASLAANPTGSRSARISSVFRCITQPALIAVQPCCNAAA